MVELETGDTFELKQKMFDNIVIEVYGTSDDYVFFKNGSKVPRQRVEEDIESGKLVRQS